MTTFTPKKLFLLDAIGAILSAFLLGIVLTTFEPIIGMPTKVLYFLALLPCCFAVYDVACYFLTTKNWSLFLKIIATANLVYCLISIGLLLQHYQQLTALGLFYFFVEIIIILMLVFIELRTALLLRL